jgi:hypothetical protein
MRHNLRYRNKRFKSKAQYARELRFMRFCAAVLVLWFLASLTRIGIDATVTRIKAFAESMPAAVLGYVKEPEHTIELIETDMPDAALHELLIRTADKYGIDWKPLYEVVKCESAGTFDPTIQSYYTYPNGGREQSYGICQYHLPDHPDMTREQAEDPAYCLDRMAREWSEGKQNKWSCFKILKRNGTL